MTHAIDGEYIKEWLILGPFFPDDLDKDFLAEAGGEANIEPREGDVPTTTDGRTLKWKRYESRGNVVDLQDPVGEHEYTTAYAFCVLESEGAGDAEFYVGKVDYMLSPLSVANLGGGSRVSACPRENAER